MVCVGVRLPVLFDRVYLVDLYAYVSCLPCVMGCICYSQGSDVLFCVHVLWLLCLGGNNHYHLDKAAKEHEHKTIVRSLRITNTTHHTWKTRHVSIQIDRIYPIEKTTEIHVNGPSSHM